MKVKFVYCDICNDKIIGDGGDIRIKYRAKRKWYLWYEGGWNRIDICANCLSKIISAKESITWIVGKDNCQVAVRNMPIDKMQKICEIIGSETK